MKYLLKVLILSFIILCSISCRSQMIQTVSDLNKLDSNKTEFIGKPLDSLFKEIKLEIKSAVLSPGGFSMRPSYIIFYFVSNSDYHKYMKDTGKKPAHIRVLVKEDTFDINMKGIDWTEEDKKKYGGFTIGYIWVNN